MSDRPTRTELIEWLVLNMECNWCPYYKRCFVEKPKMCSGVLKDSDDLAGDVIYCANRRIAAFRSMRSMIPNGYLCKKIRELRRVIRAAKQYEKQEARK